MADGQICLADTIQRSPLSENFSSDTILRSVRNAARGGVNTRDYFTKEDNYYYLFQNLAGGGLDAWSVTEDAEHGLPLYYLKSEDGDGNSYYIELMFTDLDVQDGNVQSNGTRRSSNGIDYNGIGFATVTTGYNSVPLSKISSWVGMAGLTVAFCTNAKLIAPLLSRMAIGLANGISRVVSSAASTAAEAAAEIELADFELTTAIGEEAGIDVGLATAGISAGALSLIGVGIGVAIVCLILWLILHNSYHRVRLWNITRYKATWDLFVMEGGMVAGPVKFDDNSKITTFYPFEHVCGGSPVPGARSTPQAHYYDFSVNSNSQLHGIGYAMQLKLHDFENEDNIKYTCTLMFDIPWIGSNSTSVTFGPVPNLADWYYSQEGANVSTKQTATSDDSNITATTTYDYLSGKHKVPTNGAGETNEQYFYQSLVVLEEASITPHNLPECSPMKKAS